MLSHNLCFRYILAQALLEVHAKENVTQAPANCNKSGTVWLTGKLLFEYIRKQILGAGEFLSFFLKIECSGKFVLIRKRELILNGFYTF